MRIVVAVTNDLVTDQRVARTCRVLHEAGHELLLVGRRLPDSPPIERQYAVCRMRLLFKRRVWFYAEYNVRLFAKLLFANFDAVYANDLDTLPAAVVVARVRGKKVVFDAHEIFPEVPELVGRPRVKRFWQRLERRFVPRADACITVCQSVADYYKQLLGVEMAVVRNVPDMPDAPADAVGVPEAFQKLSDAGYHILLYQGAVNVGRGIERLIEAMQYLPGYRLAVAGAGDLLEALKAQAAAKEWRHRIVFLGRLSPEQLHVITPMASLGMCLLDNMGLNYYLSLPNRVGDFVAAGVPLLATDFPELRAVLATYGVGYLVHDEGAPQLAELIKSSLGHWQSLLLSERAERMARAKEFLSYSRDRLTLLSVVLQLR